MAYGHDRDVDLSRRFCIQEPPAVNVGVGPTRLLLVQLREAAKRQQVADGSVGDKAERSHFYCLPAPLGVLGTDRVEDLLWWEGDRLLGFLGIYGFESSPELAGMVSPDGGVLDHSEHTLVLSGEPTAGSREPAITVRSATVADLPLISHLLELGFGEPAPSGLAERLDSTRERTSIVELSGSAVGTLRFRRDGDDARIYGFVIETSWQSRGLGRAALRRACEQLRAEGAHQIGLEVDVENDRALTLYTSVGFTPILAEDYYALPVS